MRLVLAFLVSLTLCAADYEWVFRNVRIVDGTGNPWYHGDVAVADGRIAAVGRMPDGYVTHEIDATGKVLAPGFIDVHTHIEGTIRKVPLGDNFVFDGVTTVVTGNCGGSEIDLAKFFAELEELGLGLNVASLVGHGSVRRTAMGPDDRAPTAEEMDRMRELVETAMRDGAVGLSTGLIYAPGVYAKTDELIALARVAARHRGVYATHLRDEGAGIFEAIEEAVRIGREADLPVQISHFKIDNKRLWGESVRSIGLVEQARRDGVDVVVDQYPYDRSSTGLTSLLPKWALAGGGDKIRERLKDAATQARIAAEMEADLRDKGFEDYSFAMVADFEPERSLEGKTISQINLMRGREKTLANEILTVMELVNLGQVQMIFHKMSEGDVERILRYPNTAVGSDGGTREFGIGKPHPRSYGTNARVLARYVREKGVLRLEDAIRRMTSLPARTFGFTDRGLIREGMAADLVLFDPEAVQDNATFDDPHRFSDGFELVLVNGVAVVEDGKLTGRRPGRVLRHGYDDSAH